MSKNSLILVMQNKQENPTIDMVKVQIKSEKLTPFGGIFSIMEQFDSTLSSVIDSTWRKRSIPTHSGWLYPLTFDAGKGVKED